jgi:PAS domain S-box-containing protein
MDLPEKFLDATDDIICVSDGLGKLVFVNKKGKEVFGIDDVASKDFFCSDCFGCNYIEQIPKVCLAKDLREGSESTPIQFSTQIGSQIFQLSCTPIYNRHNNLINILHIAKDITEQVSKEKRLKNLNTILQTIRNINQIIITTKDVKEILRTTCKTLLKNLNYGFVAFLPSEHLFFGKDLTIYVYDEFYVTTRVTRDGREVQIPLLLLERAKAKEQDCRNIGSPRFYQWKEELDGITLLGSLFTLIYLNRCYGCIVIYSKEQEQQNEEEIQLLCELADDISSVLYILEVEKEMQEAEAKTREEERFYRRLLETPPGFVYRCKNDRFWTMEYLSDNFQKITGYRPDEVIGNKFLSFNDLIHPDHQERIWVKWQTELRKHKTIQDEYPIITKSGEIHWVFEQSCGIYDENGNVQAIQGYIVDVTGRKMIEERLVESEKKYRALFEASTDAVFLMIADTFVDCNFSALKLFEVTKEELIGQTPYFFSPTYQPDGLSSKEKALDYIRRAYKGEVLRFEWVHKTSKGNLITTQVSLNRVQVDKKSYLVAIVRDLSEIEKLNYEFKKLAQALQSIGDSVVITGLDKCILYVNNAFKKMYGYTEEEILGKNALILFPKGSTADTIEQIFRSAESEGVYRAEATRIRRDGSSLVVHLTVAPILDEQNKPFAYVSVATDLTEKKMLESALRESEAKFRTLVESMDDIVYTLDKSHKHIGLFGKWLERWGLKEENLLGKTAIEIFGEEEGKIHIEMQEMCLNTDESVVYEWSHNEDGTTYYFQTRISPLKNDSGEIVGIVGIGRDITAIKQAQLELVKFEFFLQNSPLSILVTDLDANIVFANKKLFELTGYTFEELYGKNTRIFQSGLTPRETYEELWSCLLRGEIWKGEFCNRKKNGEILWESAVIAPLKDKSGKTINYIAIKEDITEKKKLIEELIQAKEKAEELSSLKSFLLTNLSHELRTPLTWILGYAQLLMLEGEDPKLKEIGSTFYQSGHRLMTTINLLMDYSKIESGLLIVRPNEFNLVEIVNDLIQLYSTFFQDKHLKVQFSAEYEQILMYQDEFMVRSIVSNLISNAFKFTREGEIEARISKFQRNGKEFVEFSVRDTGVGIAPEHLDSIWKEFFQVSQGLSRAFEGSGLGLTIVKKFVELMGGEVKVSSKVDKGSVFTVILPIRYVKNDY